MIDDELEQGELDTEEETSEPIDDIGPDSDEPQDFTEDGETPPPARKTKPEMEPEDIPTVAAKQAERDALAKAMEEFLARGGKVQELPPEEEDD